MSELQWQFLRGQFLDMSIMAALQRASVYKKEATANERAAFRDELRTVLLELAGQYSETVTEKQHVENISLLADRASGRCGICLEGERLRFGIAQKALNLYLKYLWCAGRIPMPPHCPFDSIVISKLPSAVWTPWTRIENVAVYLALVSAAKAVAGTVPLAEWELRIYGTGLP